MNFAPINLALAAVALVGGAGFSQASAQSASDTARGRFATTLNIEQLNDVFAAKTEGQIGDSRFGYTLTVKGSSMGWVDGPAKPPTSNPDADPDKWYVARSADAITDRVTWGIAHYDPALFFTTDEKGNLVQVCAMAQNASTEPAYLRHDKDPAIPLPDDGCTYDAKALSAIKAQLQTGQSTLIRTYSWPKETSNDKRFDSSDFKIVLALHNFLRARIKE